MTAPLRARGSLHIYFFMLSPRVPLRPRTNARTDNTTGLNSLASRRDCVSFCRPNQFFKHTQVSIISLRTSNKRIFFSGCGLRRDHLHETRPQTPNEFYSSLCTTFCGCGQRESEINPHSRECNWRWPKIELWLGNFRPLRTLAPARLGRGPNS